MKKQNAYIRNTRIWNTRRKPKKSEIQEAQKIKKRNIGRNLNHKVSKKIVKNAKKSEM
ncbi:MAG: hypothetical protein QW664_02875 [Thermoplasmata archaeon]